MGVWVWVWIYLLFLIEAALIPAAFAIRGQLWRAERRLASLARHRAAPLAVGALAVLLRLAVLPIEGVPVPGVHDEFSYLLAADTFLHGRLANPTHPMWAHFETMHEEHQPTYASMYPPAQGLVLAAGTLLSGSAFTGVLLSVGAMCTALCWALRGWFPPGWALLGAALAAVRLGMFSYWADSYWGGALSALGGALVFGALPRLVRASRGRDAALGALGMVILVNVRPYEGVVFAVAAGIVLMVLRRAAGVPIVCPTLILTVCVVLLPAGALMGYYNWRVFGSPAIHALQCESRHIRGGADFCVAGAAVAAAAVSAPGDARLLHGLRIEAFSAGEDTGRVSADHGDEALDVLEFLCGTGVDAAAGGGGLDAA